jgi:hypothetical protein
LVSGREEGKEDKNSYKTGTTRSDVHSRVAADLMENINLSLP